MLRLPLSAAAAAASLVLASLVVSAPVASAASVYNPNGNYHVQGGVHAYGSGSAQAHYPYGNEAVFPNTEDHSAECINGYRWVRHNHDWDKTTGQDTLPLRC